MFMIFCSCWFRHPGHFSNYVILRLQTRLEGVWFLPGNSQAQYFYYQVSSGKLKHMKYIYGVYGVYGVLYYKEIKYKRKHVDMSHVYMVLTMLTF